MPQPDAPIGSPENWIARARSSLAIAKIEKPDDALWEDLCFHTQQAVEKALKAVLLKRSIPFRFIHDLNELITVLENHDVAVPDTVKQSSVLTEYAVQTRYPGTFELVTEEEYIEAVQFAVDVVQWAADIVYTS